jgi:hypothetical protein
MLASIVVIAVMGCREGDSAKQMLRADGLPTLYVCEHC